MFKREYFNKEDLNTFFTYGYMEFDFKQAMTYYFVFELPVASILFIIFYMLKH